MIFTPPPSAPAIEVPTNIAVGDYCLRSHDALELAKDPYVCALSEKTYNATDLRNRVDLLSRALSQQLGWQPNQGSTWDKIVGIFSVNTLDYIIVSWAVHRLGGLCLLLHATSSASEIATHLGRAPCTAVFTCEPLLDTFTEATKLQGQPPKKVFLLDVLEQLLPEGHVSSNLPTFSQLVEAGKLLEPVDEIEWMMGQGEEQVAYLCPTSGTSGTQKLAKITHAGIIANVMQLEAHERGYKRGQPEIGLGFLPQSHVYGLMLSHALLNRGDTMVLHPQFDLHAILESIAAHRIERLYLVPPVIGAFIQYPTLLNIVDLSSVTTVVSGAAPFTKSLADALHALRPTWDILPGWGLTEGGGASSLTCPGDFVPGSSGPLMPGMEVRLLDAEDREVEGYDTRGEILMKAPSLIKGYLHDDASNRDLLTADGWLRTGDIGLFRKSPKGVEHLYVVDRTKELIKVNGMQVAPTELENHLILHPAVADVAVIGIPDAAAGERPKAFVVRTKTAKMEEDVDDLKDSINEHVEAHLSQAHWLGKRIEFIDQIPKSASGKVLKRLLRERK